MSHITLNGYALSTKVGGRERPRIIGKDRRAVSGQMRRTVRATKKEWAQQTIRQPSETVDIVDGLIRGLGNVWHFDTDLYSTKGLTSDATARYTLEPSVGEDDAAIIDDTLGAMVQFGAASMGIWDSTSNLFSDDIRNAKDATAFAAVVSATLTDEVTKTIDGDSVKVVTPGLGGGREGVQGDRKSVV